MTATSRPRLRLGWGRPDRLGLTILAGVWGVSLGWGWWIRPASMEKFAAGGGGASQIIREKIDPNTASAASLRRLPGIGPARAGAIIEHRRQSRPDRRAFERAEDLQAVSGIGHGTVKRIRADLALPASGLAGGESSPE